MDSNSSALLWRAFFLYLPALVFIPVMNAAPGDVQLEILSYTGDANVGPNGNSITSFVTSPTADVAPVAIDDLGVISFAANVNVGGDFESGFYRAFSPGVVSTILQTDGLAPGLWRIAPSEPGGIRFLPLDQGRGFAMSPNGESHAFNVFTRFDGPFLYGAVKGTVENEPITWPIDIGENRNLWRPAVIDDGRGANKVRSGGISGRMVVADNGTIFWQLNDAILSATSKGDLHAVMFTGTDAPGFQFGEVALLDAPLDFRGIDSLNNAVFQCRVDKLSGRVTALYRQNDVGNTLDLLYVTEETKLPGLDGGVAQIVDPESIVVLEDGTVFIRAQVSGTNTGGFWKILLDGTIELVGLFSSNGFNPTPTDNGDVEFRSLTFGDWAVSENHSVFFTADLRNGADGTSQEGIWRIDPVDYSISTVARAPLNGTFGDAPGTTATYKIFSNLTAAGNEELAFTAQLSDGKNGLFATDASGGVVKIAIEGQLLDGFEVQEGEPADKYLIQSFHFTPDHAGEDLIVSKGSPGLNRNGELAFLATLSTGDNQYTALVRASYEGVKVPQGNTYTWDGGAGDTNWHTVVDGRSNWVDIVGTPWDKAPPFDGSAEIFIGSDFLVEVVNEEVYVNNIFLTDSSLEIHKVFSFDGTLTGTEDSSIIFSEDVVGGRIRTFGLISKEGSKAVDLMLDKLEITEADLLVREGRLDLVGQEMIFTDAPIQVEGGFLHLSGPVTFRGEEFSLEVKASSGSDGILISSEDLFFESYVYFEAEQGSEINWGAQNSDITKKFHFAGDDGGGNLRVELTGDGEHNIYESLDIPVNISLSLSSGIGFNRPGGVFISLPESGEITAVGICINAGNLTMSSGGIRGDFFNSGTLNVVGPIAFLDCENSRFGTIHQGADILYGSFKAEKDSEHFLSKTANLVPKDKDISELNFEEDSELKAETGSSRIVFPSLDSPNLEARVEVGKAASLDIENVNAGINGRFRVREDGELHIKNLIYGNREIWGKGKLYLEGEINPLDDVTKIQLNTQFLDIKNADLFSGIDGSKVVYEFASSLSIFGFSDGQVSVQNVTLSNVTTHAGAEILSSIFTDITVKEPITLGASTTINGTLTLENDVRIPSGPELRGGILLLGGEDEHFRGSSIFDRDRGNPYHSGRLSISPNLADPVIFEPELQFGFSRASEVIVGEGSRLIISSSNIVEQLREGNLFSGIWIIKDFAACEVFDPGKNPEIRLIGSSVQVSLERPHPSLPSFVNLPSPISDLTVLGTLKLTNTNLQMNGNILRNRKAIIHGKHLNSKIIGTMHSLRNEVGDVVQLAGLNIEGSLILGDGAIIALGASPGSGLITVDLTLLPGSEMRVEFAGADPGTGFDFLEVGGAANLGGKLTLSLIDEYVPDNGEAFLFLKAGAIAGSFSDIDQSALGWKRRFDVTSGVEGLTATMQALSIATYSDWRTAFFSPTEVADDLISGINSDPDQDGIENLAEYISGGIPKGLSLAPLIIVNSDPESFGLQLASDVTDYTWSLETSGNLFDWSVVDVDITELSVEEDVSFFGLDLQNPPADGNRFYRLGIDLAQP